MRSVKPRPIEPAVRDRIATVVAAQADPGHIDLSLVCPKGGDFYPAGTLATHPTGGFLLWVELPEGCDSNRLFDPALASGISITPGNLFSPSGRFDRHLRLSGCYPFSDRHIHALVTLGQLAGEQLVGER